MILVSVSRISVSLPPIGDLRTQVMHRAGSEYLFTHSISSSCLSFAIAGDFLSNEKINNSNSTVGHCTILDVRVCDAETHETKHQNPENLKFSKRERFRWHLDRSCPMRRMTMSENKWLRLCQILCLFSVFCVCSSEEKQFRYFPATGHNGCERDRATMHWRHLQYTTHCSYGCWTFEDIINCLLSNSEGKKKQISTSGTLARTHDLTFLVFVYFPLNLTR